MRPQKICIICGEYKEHHAHGMCRQCYNKKRKAARPWKICKACGKYKEYCAKGMCRGCYRRERRVARPPKPRKLRKPTNPQSATYLGCDVAEKVLSKVFNNVKVMPYGNPGYDFICNKGKKIDVKSSCMGKNEWKFHIKRNIIADFFLCIAFDDRKLLTPLHLWLIPSDRVKDKKSIGIRPNTFYKWDEFKLDILKTLRCCDEMRR